MQHQIPSKIEGLQLTVNPNLTSFSLAYKKPQLVGEHWILCDQKPIIHIGDKPLSRNQIANMVIEKLTEVVGSECIPLL